MLKARSINWLGFLV